MISSDKRNVQLFVKLCVHFGTKHVVVSPGSRNAPLTISFNQHPEIECYVIPDERSAAFFAMGLAQQSEGLVAILCTSGSAPLNYYPAIAEAFYQRIPLMVISADRPDTWVDQGDGQTINQNQVFANHINYSLNLVDNRNDADYQWFLNREVSKSFSKMNGESKGPVHVNFGFNEPLYSTVEIDEVEDELVKAIDFQTPRFNLSEVETAKIKEKWENSSKKLVICGQLNPDSFLLEQMKELAIDTSVLIVVENLSNLIDQHFIHCTDRFLNSLEEQQYVDFCPDILLVLGNALVSKKIKTLVRKLKIRESWKVGLDFPSMDTFQNLSKSFQLKEIDFVLHLNSFSRDKVNSNYGPNWKQKDFLIQEKSENYFENDPSYSDLSVFHEILDFVPENSFLHLANSSVVRYSLLFDPVRSIKYFGNRGTSGIDGSTSTALGHAVAKPSDWHTLITGDMSFFYDSNAFWNHQLVPNFRIFLINNGGGSIFKIIPGPDSTKELNDFFVFNNNFSAEYICQAFRLKYYKSTNLSDIESQMEEFYTFEENSSAKLMEIFTNEVENEQVLKDFFEKLKL